ncbi:MAG: hypothetical protein Q3995_01760 [Eubacteriales bacterium]|nr:hypothetical protein [Eubacteriales bacterium]
MLNLRLALLAQFPAFFLLSAVFLINYLIVRKRSAVKSVLWVLLFGIMLAVSILFCFLGIQAKFWTIKTLFKLSVWSWIGVTLVVVFLVLHLVHSAEKKHAKYVMEKELKKAEKQKEAAVAQAREEGKAEAMREAAPVVPPAEESPAEEASADVSPDSSTDAT